MTPDDVREGSRSPRILGVEETCEVIWSMIPDLQAHVEEEVVHLHTLCVRLAEGWAPRAIQASFDK